MINHQKAKYMKSPVIILALVAGLALTGTLKAQDQAKKVLDDVSTQLSSFKTIHADFSFTLQNKEADISDTFEGNLVIEGKKFRLSMMGMLILCDGTKIWNYSEEMNEANILDPDESDFFNPTQIFTLYQQDFKLETMNHDGSVYDIKLTPEKDDQEYSHIVLKVDSKKKLIIGATYYGTDGNTYIIKISNTIPDIPLDDRFFIFDKSKYPGVVIYDMR